jgi:tetratricopeptide (TPR) repeat protein
MDPSEKKIDLERSLREANLAYRTGRSAYENENYQLAEPLLIKALDAFELTKATDSHDYFSCLHSLADTYFHLERYYEAKAYYERLSVGRLQSNGSSDAQIVVSLLKLAATQEKLEDYDSALSTYDLIFEMVQTSIPRGHALMSVVLESMEAFIKSYILDEDERESRLEIITKQKRDSGFAPPTEEEKSGTLSGSYTGLPGFSSSDSNLTLSKDRLANDSLLAQEPQQLHKSLKAWTNPDLEIWSLSKKIARETTPETAQDTLPEAPPEPAVEIIYAPTAPDEFIGRSTSSHLRIVHPEEPQEHAHPSGRLRNYDSDNVAEKKQIQLEHKLAPKPPKASLRNQTNQERFNPKPLITGLVIAGIIGGAILWAQEYAKTTVATNTGIRNTGGINLSGQNYSTADGKKKLRFISGTICEANAGGRSVTAEYKDVSLKGSSFVTKLMNSSKKVYAVTKVGSSLIFPDGIIFYAEDSDGQKIVTKMQAMAMAAQTYYAGHNHNYPDSAEDFTDPIVNFSYRNPLTGSRNKPVIAVANHSAEIFDQSFVDHVRDMRNKKSIFAQDETEHPPSALIECMSLQPTGNLNAERAGSGFLIRAYDPNGKLITSAVPEKAFVIALKNGIAVDPIKASQDTEQTTIEFPDDLVLEIQNQDK